MQGTHTLFIYTIQACSYDDTSEEFRWLNAIVDSAIYNFEP